MSKGIKVIITGASGFIGLGLAERLISNLELKDCSGTTTKISQIILFDCFLSDDIVSLSKSNPSIFKTVLGSLNDVPLIDKHFSLVNHYSEGEEDSFDGLTVFHLASILSGQGEEDFDLCIAVNLDGTRNILEALRRIESTPTLRTKLIFTSTAAVYGLVDKITDDSPLEPSTTYGNTKICSEKLLSDYHRKHFLVGAGVRLPTVLLRFTPNQAASNSFNAVLREPLLGNSFSVPVPFSFVHPFTSRRVVIESLIHLHNIITDPEVVYSDSEQQTFFSNVNQTLGISRMLVLPGHSKTLQELYDASLEYGKNVLKLPSERIGKVVEGVDKKIEQIVKTWPTHIEANKAISLGFPNTFDVNLVLEDFVQYHKKKSSVFDL